MRGDDPEPRRRALPRRTVFAVSGVVAAAWLVADQLLKVLAVALLSDRVIDLVVADLRLVRNPGGAFGIPGLPGMFVVVTVVVLVLVGRALPHADRLGLAIAYGLVTGGALGNVCDRIFRAPGFPSGHVVDYLDLRWWPVFNLADVGIVCGAALVAAYLIAEERQDQSQQTEPAARTGP